MKPTKRLVKINSTPLKSAPFGKFSDKIVGYGATTFSGMYYKIFKKYWNNSIFARVRRNYYHSNFQDGFLEVYVPTFANQEENMSYHRIVLKVVPGLDQEIFENQIQEVRHSRKVSDRRTRNRGGPAGKIDSESIFIIAPRLSPKGLGLWREDRERRSKGEEPKRKWVLRARYLTTPGIIPRIRVCPVIARAPEVIMIRLLKVITGFYEDRLKAVLRSLHLGNKLSEWQGSITATLLYITSLVEKKGLLTLANAMRCLVHTLNWLRLKRRQIIEHLAQQSHIMNLIHKIKPYQPVLEKIKLNHNPFQLEPDSPLIKTLIQLCHVATGPPHHP